MILVTGTKCSGTSLWMQILLAAGHAGFGDAFPSSSESSLREAKFDGFYASSFRDGIYYATNPNPRTGKYVFPEQVERHAVKVSPLGVVRTDRAYIRKVIATLRPWREYVVSVERLYALEDAGRDPATNPVRFSPALEWFSENYALIRDVSMRRYAAHFESLGRAQREPERVITEVLGWLGSGDIETAVRTVKPEHRPLDAPEADGLEPAVATVCDELCATIDERRPLSAKFIGKLNAVHETLLPRLRDEEARVRLDAERRRRLVPA
jgi:hypothetical protein